jgi:hypothetical protein
VIFQIPCANLGALQILQNTNRAILFPGDAAEPFNADRVRLMTSMREVKPRNVHAQPDQVPQHVVGIAGGPYGANDLGATAEGQGPGR